MSTLKPKFQVDDSYWRIVSILWWCKLRWFRSLLTVDFCQWTFWSEDVTKYKAKNGMHRGTTEKLCWLNLSSRRCQSLKEGANTFFCIHIIAVALSLFHIHLTTCISICHIKWYKMTLVYFSQTTTQGS